MSLKKGKKMDILAAAIKVFSGQGFGQARIEEIAHEAGVGKGTVYEYFRNKDHLFQETIQYSVEKYRELLEAAIAEGTIEEQIYHYAKNHLEFFIVHKDLMESAFQSNPFSGEIREWLKKERFKILKIIEDMVKQAIARGELREGLDPQIAALCITGAVKQFNSKKFLMDESNPEEIDHNQVVELILNGLK